MVNSKQAPRRLDQARIIEDLAFKAEPASCYTHWISGVRHDSIIPELVPDDDGRNLCPTNMRGDVERQQNSTH